MLTRRQLLARGAIGGAGLMLPRALFTAGGAVAAPSVAGALTPYVDPLPPLVDNAISATGGGVINLSTALITRAVHRDLPPVTLFGYLRPGGPGPDTTDASYLGPAIVAKSGVPVTVKYANGLKSDDYLKVFTNGGSSYAQLIDKDDLGATLGVRILTHLHGGFVAGADDGNPYASSAIASGGTQTVTYPNEQPASLLWYHDHYEGDTRMNVVAGLAAGYLLRDNFDTGSNQLLPGPIGVYELPLVVQDRQFVINPDKTASLLYPTASGSLSGPWIGEYFGDVMLVNGKVWPKLTVKPAVYRFRVLNGCNARILNLKLAPQNDQTVPMYIIGAEGGLLPAKPVIARNLVMAPAERLDVLVDFRPFAGKTLFIKNTNPPRPVVTPAPSLSQVMQITVAATAPSGAPSSVPASLPANDELAGLAGLGSPALSGGSVKSRMITLNEIGAETDHWKLNINAAPYGDSEALPPEELKWNDVEDWYYCNFTGDTHPMHTHLFTFKVMGRYNFDAAGYAAQYGGANGVPQAAPDKMINQLTPFLTSGLLPPDPTEFGFKDTVKANPGQVTVVRAQFKLPSTALTNGTLVNEQRYVHHCHIVEHEDNDMMERFVVKP
jgi:FtsP/CotA-like multicopper oxidase with cupredoxin domain